MINEDPNMGRKQIFTELPLPSKVEEKGILTLIYKGIFIAVKLLLDIRLNLVKISEGKTIKTKFKQVQENSGKPDIPKPENPIKGLDNIKIEEKLVKLEEGSVSKGGVNDKPTTPRPTEEPKAQKSVEDSNIKPYEKKEETNEAINDTDKPSEEK